MALDRHPIPKNLMDIEFKLFGSLTATQFGYLAGCFFVCLIVYISKLPSFITWSLIGFFGILGVMLTFFNVNGLTFDKWLVNFLQAMLTPQRKVWKKSHKIPKVLENDGLAIESKHIQNNVNQNRSVNTTKKKINLSDYEEKIFKNIDTYIRNDSMIDRFMKDSVGINSNISLVENPSTANLQKENEIKTPKDEVALFQQVQKSENLNQSQTRVGYIFGKVVSQDNHPIQGLDILLQDHKFNLIRQTQTNQKGDFYFSNTFEFGLYYIFIEDKQKRKMKFANTQINLDAESSGLIIIKEQI